jgi:hypothetical protein
MDKKRDEGASRQWRITLLISVLWSAGLITTLAHGAARNAYWSSVSVTYLVSIIAIFFMGAAAVKSASQGSCINGQLCMILLLLGIGASLLTGEVFAAFIIFILCGFVLDWWGIIKD